MSEIAKKPFFLWSCILHVSILLFLILSVSLSGSSASSSSSPQQTIVHATVVSSQVLTQYQNAIIQKQVAKQQAIQKIQDVLKAEQIAQEAAKIAQAKAIADAKVAAEKATADAKAAAMKQSIEKQLKASMQKQLASTKPSTKPTSKPTAKPSTKPSTVSGVQSNPGLADKYKAMIIQAISEQWIVPQNLPKNISCVLNVRVAPGGVVIQVTVEKSSGNPILDNSAVAAVNKASPLPVPTDPTLFDTFRTLKLTVKPDGSLLEA